jgi:hypothetical protein
MIRPYITIPKSKIIFPDNPTINSLSEFIEVTLKERIALDLIYKPWNVEHTKELDNKINFLVHSLINEVISRYDNLQVLIIAQPYSVRSKYSKRKRKKLYIGEFRKFQRYVIKIEDWCKNYKELIIITHDFLKR